MKKLLLGIVTMLAVQIAWADKIILLEGTKESIEARKDLISTAHSEIRAQYFTIEDDIIANGALAILRDLALKKPSVKIRIIVDSMHNLMLKETMAAFLTDNNGETLPNVEIKEYNTFKRVWYAPWRYTKRMHDKGLIIDNDALISGGRNVANGYYGLANDDKPTHAVLEDTDALVLESAAIKEAAQYFDDLWKSKFVSKVSLGAMSKDRLKEGACDIYKQAMNNIHDEKYRSCEMRRAKALNLVLKQQVTLNQLAAEHRNTTITKESVMQKWLTNPNVIETGKIDYIFDNPIGQKSNLDKPKATEDNIAKQLYQAIQTAKKSVVIVTPYFVVTPEQEQLFKELRARKVKVRVFTNGTNSNDVVPAHVGYLNTRQIALQHGVQIYEYNGPDTLHAKMVLVDRAKLFIGSFNWDFRSQNLNREVGIIADLPDVSRKVAKETDVYAKFARIYARSTKLGEKSVLNGEIGEEGEFDDDDMAQLSREIRNGNKRILFWQMIYPLIKEQL
jgi:cardiolipin synthase C